MAEEMTSWVKAVGLSILLIGIILVILDKFRNIDGVGVINATDGVTTVNETLVTTQTLVMSMIDYIEIGVLILVGAFFFAKLTKKGGFGS